MIRDQAAPFESIESAREFVALLADAVDDATSEIRREIAHPSPLTRARHIDALRLVEYKLTSLRQHLAVSRGLLTDLRTLRRYLLDERATERTSASDSARPAASL